MKEVTYISLNETLTYIQIQECKPSISTAVSDGSYQYFTGYYAVCDGLFV